MKNRLVIGAASAALMLAVAVPAFAGHHQQQQPPQPVVVADIAIVDNGASSEAGTGYNNQTNGVTVTKGGEVEGSNVGGSNTLTTGNATSAALAVTVANTRVGCTTCGSTAPKYDVNFAKVGNGAESGAYTDTNGQANGVLVEKGSEVEGSNVGGSNTLRTGSACSRAGAFTVVNTRIAGVRP